MYFATGNIHCEIGPCKRGGAGARGRGQAKVMFQTKIKKGLMYVCTSKRGLSFLHIINKKGGGGVSL